MLRNSKGDVFEGNFEDFSGQKINRLTLIEPSHIHYQKSGSRILYWITKCECGNVKVQNGRRVKRGDIKSCGCLSKEVTSKVKTTHGETGSRLLRIYYNMKGRCYLESNPKFKNYGGRGITICDEWLDDYTKFSKWAKENGYKDDMTIERIDVNGNYSPENCAWISISDQAKNKTSSIRVYIDGKRYSPKELSEIHGIPERTIYRRIKVGDIGRSIVRPLGIRQFQKRPDSQ